jgi:sugar O-acyltransferase (sialic acid O-acetyltransferase NeuD family)
MKAEKKKNLVIIGAGNLGGEAAWLVEEMIAAGAPVTLAGFVDDSPGMEGKKIAGLKVLGPLSWLKGKGPGYQAVLAVGAPAPKRKIAKILKSFRVELFTVIHPRAVIGKGSVIGRGSIIFPQVTLSVNVKIGKGVLLNPGITLSHDVMIGDWCLIGSGAHLAGKVAVDRECEIGTGVSIIPGVRVGAEAIVGAGAAVVRELAPGVVAVGVPARPIKKIDRGK